MSKSGKKFEKGFEKYIAEQEAKKYELAAMLRDDWEMSMTMSVSIARAAYKAGWRKVKDNDTAAR